MTRKSLVVTVLVALSVLVSALAAPRSGRVQVPRDEPLMCPYCGGVFDVRAMGVELMREVGLRVAIRYVEIL